MGKGRGNNEPPAEYRWKPGESGNPLGRPKGSRNITTILKELLETEIEGKDPISGETVTAPANAIINAQLVKKALEGDTKSIKEIYDRIEGRPKQKLDVTGDMKIRAFLNNCMRKAVEE